MRALSNLKILDFSTLLPGPYATMMLGDMGAEVLRVESSSRRDLVRDMEPKIEGVSAKHAFLNRNKQSITLDLKNAGAIELIEALVEEYDILIEQFRPGVMDRLGLSYEYLRRINPGLIYCSVTGYGQTGPYAKRAGHDNNFLSLAGVNSYSSRKGERAPVMGTQVADIAGGSLHAVIGILAAVNQRTLTGQGQQVDISMTDAAFALNAMYGSDYLACGEEPQEEGTLLNGGSYYDYYLTADGRQISVGSLEPPFLKKLCEVTGCEELVHLGLSENLADHQTLKSTLTDIFASQSFAYWCEQFADQDACVEPVLSFSEAAANEQLMAREMIVQTPRSEDATVSQIGSAIKMSASMPRYDFIGRDIGADNRSVLDKANLSSAAKARIIASGAMS